MDERVARTNHDAEPLSDDDIALIGATLISVSPAAALGFRDDVPRDYIETLLDLALAGDEVTFRDLALAVGVPAAKVAGLWTGALARARA